MSDEILTPDKVAEIEAEWILIRGGSRPCDRLDADWAWDYADALCATVRAQAKLIKELEDTANSQAELVEEYMMLDGWLKNHIHEFPWIRGRHGIYTVRHEKEGDVWYVEIRRDDLDSANDKFAGIELNNIRLGRENDAQAKEIERLKNLNQQIQWNAQYGMDRHKEEIQKLMRRIDELEADHER